MTGEISIQRTPSGALAGRFGAMASPCEVLVDGASEDELRALTAVAAREAWRIERLWSRYRTDNVIYRINAADGEPVTVDAETAHLLDYAAHLHEWSGGLFDVTSGVLRWAWTFDGSDHVPAREEVAAILPLVGWDKVTWRTPVLQMKPGMQIDLGGLGKEYAVDRAVTLVSDQTAKPVLVNFGGDVAAAGPHRDGSPWQVGVDTGVPGARPPLVRLSRGGVATSGDAHRYLMKDGIRYPHVLNPKTGWAVTGAPRAVTVAASSCTEAGVLSTIALLQGASAEAFLKECGADYAVTW